jgi:hypothetical protein
VNDVHPVKGLTKLGFNSSARTARKAAQNKIMGNKSSLQETIVTDSNAENEFQVPETALVVKWSETYRRKCNHSLTDFQFSSPKTN